MMTPAPNPEEGPVTKTAFLLIAPLLCLGLILTGCASGPSAGWTQVVAGQLSLERPTSWQEAQAPSELWTQRYVGDGMELQIAPLLSEDPTASAAFSQLDLPAMLHLSGYQGGSVKKADVPGADTAVRSDFSYTEDGVTKRGIWVIAGQYPYPRTAAIAISGARLDDGTAQHIIDSLRFTKARS